MPRSLQSPTADRALWLALAAFGAPDGDEPRFRSAFARPGGPRPETPAAAALADLRGQHAAESRPDFARVHRTWTARALAGESPALLHALAARGPDLAIRAAARHALGLLAGDPVGLGPVDPEALEWALALWSERLAGGPPPGPDDPPVIRAVAQLGSPARFRLTVLAGRVKRACLDESPGPSGPEGWPIPGDDDTTWDDRIDAIDEPFDPQFLDRARLDLAERPGLDRRGLADLGLLTIGRLLAAAEPFRARWASQHLSYPVAKRVRSGLGLGPGGRVPPAWRTGEARIFRAALAHRQRRPSGGGPR